LGTAFGVFGAFGTDTLPLVIRIIYWSGGFVLAWVAFQLVLIVTRASARLIGLPLSFAYLLGIPVLAALIAIAVTLFAQDADLISLGKFVQILAIGFGIFVLFWGLYARKYRAPKPAGNAPANSRSVDSIHQAKTPLHARLAPDFGIILALQAEDHYVRVVGAETSAMILINFSNAIAEMGANNGVRLHRGWWAASGAVKKLKKDGRNMKAILLNDMVVPVSRANIANAKANFGDAAS
jgi:hypothetical protein